MKALVEQHDPEATSIRVVQENLHTPTPGSFSAAFTPDEACQRAPQFACHDTPTKGSGLNLAAIERAAVSKQCLDRRLGDRHALASEVHAWTQQRKALRATVQWRFTTQAAREKLPRHSPVTHNYCSRPLVNARNS
jgi:hypothetical protein